LADGWKTSVGEFYAQNGQFPTSVTNTAANASQTVMYQAGATTGKYVSSVTAAAGAVTITYSAVAPYLANKAIHHLTPASTPYLSKNNDIVWICGTATVPTTASLDPSVTKGTTNVPPQYLPSACHP